MFGKRSDDRPSLEQALATAAGIGAGSWESVRALALLARADRVLRAREL